MEEEETPVEEKTEEEEPVEEEAEADETDEDKASACCREPEPTVETLLKLHDELRAYDIHYSTARIGISTFTISIGIGLWTFVVIPLRPDDWLSVAIALFPLAFFASAVGFSAQFRKLSRSCRVIQYELEELLHKKMLGSNAGPEDLKAIRIRTRMSELLKDMSVWKLLIDSNNQRFMGALVVLYLAYWIAAVLLPFWSETPTPAGVTRGF